MSPRRVDIQALRGIAVLYVIVYHAGFGFPKSGFLGVDIFFVISGYLITGMICRELDAGEFSILEFYWRRAKRLLPATYCTLFITAVLSVFALTQAEFSSFVSQLLGSLALISNVVLWYQTGYFDIAAQLKPLLHMWSLSIEEQFYLLWPALLIATPLRYRNLMISALLAASLISCFALVADYPSASFYLLPTRAWELLIGALGATWKPNLGARSERNVGIVAAAVIFLLPALQLDPVHPRFDALLVCVATLAALWTSPAILRNNVVATALGKVGDISFSLYLVHWPLLALSRNMYLGPLPATLKLAVILLSFPLATAQYWLVENPIHRSRLRPTRAAILAICLGAIAIAAFPVYRMAGISHERSWAEARRPVTGFGGACDYKTAAFTHLAGCQSSEHPKIAVWGDSYAMQLVPGMQATDPGFGIVQATRATCGPFFSVAPTQNPLFPPETCLGFNEAVRAYLVATPDIQYVVLSSPFAQYIFTKMLVFDTGERTPPTPQLVTKYLGETVQKLRAMERRS